MQTNKKMYQYISNRLDVYDTLCIKYDISEIIVPDYLENIEDKKNFIDYNINNEYSILVIIKEPIHLGIWMNYDIGMRFSWINISIMDKDYNNYNKMKIIEIESNNIIDINKWSFIKLLSFWKWIKKTDRHGIEYIQNKELYKNEIDYKFLEDLDWRDE